MQRYPYRLEGLDMESTRLEIVASPTERLEYGSDFAAYAGTTPSREVGAVWLGARALIPQSNLSHLAIPSPPSSGLQFDPGDASTAPERTDRCIGTLVGEWLPHHYTGGRRFARLSLTPSRTHTAP